MRSSIDSNYNTMAASGNQETERLPGAGGTFDATRHMAPVIAHELNNILAIVQGYADRLILKHADDSSLHSQLKMIAEAARRAAIIIREATPPPSAQALASHAKSGPGPSAG
ncbi:MAG: histidine kinase dimerization/phospho-acceptor domain-containing protein [Limisphaerales bacterium]